MNVLYRVLKVCGVSAVAFVLFASVKIAFATPPTSSYTPGQTLAPGCTPGTTNCTVNPYAASGVNADITSLTAITTPLSIAEGGSGASTLTSNAVLLGNGTSALQAVGPGTAYQVFRTPSGGGAATFGAIDLSQGAAVINALSPLNGGTGLTSITANSLLYASGTNTIAALPSSTDGFVLTLVGGVPSWLAATGGTAYTAGNGLTLTGSQFTVNQSQLDLSSIGGTLPVTSGGTGVNSAFTQGSIVFAGASGVFSQNNSNLFWDNTNNALQVAGTVAANHVKGLGSAPTIVASTGAGTGGLTAPTVTVNGTDTAGTITLTTGNGVLSLGATVFTLTFATPYSTAPNVIFSPANAVTAALSGATGVFVNSTTSTFGFISGTAALTTLTTYQWTYEVIQ